MSEQKGVAIPITLQNLIIEHLYNTPTGNKTFAQVSQMIEALKKAVSVSIRQEENK